MLIFKIYLIFKFLYLKKNLTQNLGQKKLTLGQIFQDLLRPVKWVEKLGQYIITVLRNTKSFVFYTFIP